MDLDVGGARTRLLPAPAVWWPERATVLVADVHLGKVETFVALGRPLPGGELDETLARLTQLTRLTAARRVVLLGDLVHGRIGVTPALAEAVTAWRAGIDAELVLVRGNHDRHLPSLPAGWGVEVVEGPLRDGPFAFVHEPVEVPGAYTWAGHVHPAARVGHGRLALKLPAFHLGERVGLVPAFSRFSGGALRRAGPGEALIAVVGEELVSLPAEVTGPTGRRRRGAPA